MATSTSGGRVCPSCGGKGTLRTTSGANQICPNCGGKGALPPPEPIRVPFDLVLPNAVLTALQAGLPITQQLDQDADLEILEIVCSQTGLYSVQITDPSTGRPFSNSNVNGENFAGTAQLPHVLVEPYVWARSSTVKASFTDRSNAGNTIQLVFRGYKLYPRDNPAQGSQGAIVAA